MGTSVAAMWRIVVASALLVVSSACSRSSSEQFDAGRILAAAGAYQNCFETLPPDAPATMLVWMIVRALPEEEEQVAALLGEAEGVSSYTFVDRDATYATFQDYYGDYPQILDQTSPADLPTHYQVEMARTDQAELLAATLRQESVVGSVAVAPAESNCPEELAALDEACRDLPVVRARTLLVWVEAEAGSAAIEAMAGAVGAEADVASVVYVDRETTEAEFRATPDGTGPLAEDIVEMLPTRYEATTAPIDDIRSQQLIDRFEALPDVDQVTTSDPAGQPCAGIGQPPTP